MPRVAHVLPGHVSSSKEAFSILSTADRISEIARVVLATNDLSPNPLELFYYHLNRILCAALVSAVDRKFSNFSPRNR